MRLPGGPGKILLDRANRTGVVLPMRRQLYFPYGGPHNTRHFINSGAAECLRYWNA